MRKHSGRATATLAYLTIIGWVLALILHNKKERQFTKFHLQQALLIHLISMVFYFIPFLRLVNILVLIFLIIGIIYAAMGRKKEIPLIGPLALDLFNDL